MSEPNNNRINPNFFGSGYNQTPKKKANDWQEPIYAPPPPYSAVPDEPTSSRPTTYPTAPPLDVPNYAQYGSFSYPVQNNTSDANLPTWPWISPPRAPEQPVYIPHTRQPMPSETIVEQPRKQSNCCGVILKYLCGLFCISLVIRMIDLLAGVSYENSCAHGVEWEALPKEFNFEKGIKIRTVGGHLSNGQIVIKAITPATIEEDHIKIGTVRASALIFPGRLAEQSDLSFTITHFINGTILEIYIPQGLGLRACISLNAIIYVPEDTPYIDLEVQNSRITVSDERLTVPSINIDTSNKPIDFHAAWEGKILMMNSKNAHIDLNDNLKGDDIVVTTTNAPIRVRKTIEASEIIYLSTTNGGIDIDELVQSEKTIRLISYNSHINVKNITADRSEISSSNGRINIQHSNSIHLFNAHTTNGQINVNLESGARPEISIRTSNAEIYANLPAEYEGFFNFDTSSSNKLVFVDTLGWAHIDSMNRGHLAGVRLAPGQIEGPNSRAQVITSNANAHIHF